MTNKIALFRDEIALTISDKLLFFFSLQFFGEQQKTIIIVRFGALDDVLTPTGSSTLQPMTTMQTRSSLVLGWIIKTHIKRY